MRTNGHQRCVDSWLEERARGLTSDQYIGLVDVGVGALWERARRTLGDVTLRAIVDRALHSAASEHPILAAVRLDTAGIRAGRLDSRARSVAEIEGAVRCLLVELLTALGHLTADILTPALHEALRDARPRAAPPLRAPRTGTWGPAAATPGVPRWRSPRPKAGRRLSVS